MRNIHLRGVWKSQRTLPICISFTAKIDTTFDLFYLHTYVRYAQSLLISSIRQSNVFSFANLNADSSRGLVGVYGVEDASRYTFEILTSKPILLNLKAIAFLFKRSVCRVFLSRVNLPFVGCGLVWGRKTAMRRGFRALCYHASYTSVCILVTFQKKLESSDLNSNTIAKAGYDGQMTYIAQHFSKWALMTLWPTNWLRLTKYRH